ncbi:MAG: TonB-dependent receptor [Opitutales bacterium]|nr:TonB-dependent receptor [Opitutales bacterium]
MLLLGALPAYAQEKDDTTGEKQSIEGAFNDEKNIIYLEPMIVTAQMREQESIEVPIAMIAYDSSMLEQLHVSDMADLSTYVPGFEVQLQSPNNPGFAVRGITTDSGDAYEEARVSIFMDGVSISKSRGSVVELFDMERIEVLKGPQGTLFGRGASSGALSLITNKPTENKDSQVTTGINNLGYSAKGYYNTPLDEDGSVLMRVAASYRRHDGFVDNLAEGAVEDLNGGEHFAVRPSLRVKFGDDNIFDLSANYEKDLFSGTSFLQKVYSPEGKTVADVYEYGQLNRGDELGGDREVYGVTATFTLPLDNNMTLTSISAYRNFESCEEFDADGTQAYLFEFAEQAKGHQLSQELRLNWKAGEQWDGFMGANVFYQKAETYVPLRTDERVLYAHLSPTIAASVNPSLQQINTLFAAYGFPVSLPMLDVQTAILPDGSPNLSNSTIPYSLYALLSLQGQLAAGVPVTSMTLPDYTTTPLLNPLHEEAYTNYGEQTAYEIFADSTYRINGRFRITAGVRLTYEEIESGYKVDEATPSILSIVTRGTVSPANLQFAPTDGKITASNDYTSLVGRIVAEYTLADDFNTYLSYSRGRRPPVISITDTASNPQFEELEAEILNSYELGFKSFLMNRAIQLDGALFYYKYKNFATSVVRNNQIVTESAGDADALGAELNLHYLVQPGLTLFGTYSWIDGQFNGEDSVYEGNTFRLTPRNSLSLGCNYMINTENGSFCFTPSYTWKSKIYFTEDPNEESLSQGAYGLLNLNVSYKRDAYMVSLFIKNALDEAYLIDAGNTGRSLGLPTFISGLPRSYGVEFTYSF